MSDTREAAQRAAEKMLVPFSQTSVPDLWVEERDKWAANIESEFAPLLSAKDAEIERQAIRIAELERRLP